MKSLLTICLIFLLSCPALAKWQLGDLYSDAELSYWQTRYPENIEWNFNNLIMARLTPQERQRLGSVELDFPLRYSGPMRNHPLQFSASGRSITVPILSVRFFDELTQAWAYLLTNNLDLQLLGDYLAMLKYRDPAQFPEQRFPAPLDALGIPKDAWKSDAKMDDISQKALKSAIVWILAHELAHIYYQHPGYRPGVSRAQAQANERQADQFANQVMRRIGVAPIGIVEYFMALAHLDTGRGDFASDQAWQHYLRRQATHPLTANRLTTLANDLRRSPRDFTTEESDQRTALQRLGYVADQIEGIGRILEDPGMHRLTVVIGLATDLNSLRNRQRRVSGSDQNLCAGKTAATDFRGRHQGIYTRNLKNGRTEWLSASMSLDRSQNRVRGRYFFGAGEGTIEGLVSGGQRLLYDWQWGSARGKGVLSIDNAGALSGQWGYGDSPDGGGSWTLCQQ